MIPIDFFTSVIALAVAVYAFHTVCYVYRVVRLSKIALIGRALTFYLLVIAVDRFVNALFLAGISYPESINSIMWCLYIVCISLIVWEIYNYLRNIQ